MKASLWWRERLWTPCQFSPHPSDQHLGTAFPHQLCTGLQSHCTWVQVHTRLLFHIKSMVVYMQHAWVQNNINTCTSLLPQPRSSNYPHDILQTCVFVHSVMFASVKYLRVSVCELVCHTGTYTRFNIISLFECGSTISLIKNRQHEEAIWRCAMREDRLSVLWPNKCFHSIKAIRPVWSGLVGMLSLPRSIDYRQISVGLARKCCLDLNYSLSVPGVVFSS